MHSYAPVKNYWGLTMFLFSMLLCFTHRSCVRGSSVEMEVDKESLLLVQVAPWSFRPIQNWRSLFIWVTSKIHQVEKQKKKSTCVRWCCTVSCTVQNISHWKWVSHPRKPILFYSPLTPKLQASSAAPCAEVTLTSRASSSRDQLLAWATYWRVAVI